MKRRPLFPIVILACLIAFISAQTAWAQESKIKARFSAAELALFKRLAQIQTGVSTIKGALTVGVFKDIAAGSAAEKLYNVTTADWDLFVNALKATNKLYHCQAKEAIDFYLLDNKGSWPDTTGSKLLREMHAAYIAGCC